MTDASDLRWRIAFDERVTVSDGYGNEEGSFVEQFVVAAHLKPRFGGEAIIAARLQGQQPVNIIVRQSDQTREIRPDWRARDVRTGEVYAVRSIVDPDGRRQWLEILAQAGVAA